MFSIILRIFLGGDGIHLVVDENGKFREDNFAEAIGKLGGGSETGGKAKRQKDGSDCYNIVKMIMERNFAPVIVFSFSKKECEAYALQMAKLDFNTRKFEKKKNLFILSNLNFLKQFLFGHQVEIMIYFFLYVQKLIRKIKIIFVVPLGFGKFVVVALCSTDVIRFW